MSVSLFQSYFFMSKTISYAQIIIGSQLVLTAMAIHLSLQLAPLDFQQDGNYRILYVHVHAARMSTVSFIGFILLTKSLSCNVAVLIGIPFISESSDIQSLFI
jgi:ABC-type transport system involved in cytochrome c biogenesis permease subunit